MAYTALNLVTDVLLNMGVIANGVAPTAEMTVGALTTLNDLIESWNLDSLAVYGANQYILPLVGGQQVYTIGTGGNLNVARPNIITAAYLRDTSQPVTNQIDMPLKVFNNTEWADVPFKAMTANYPYYGVWFNMTYPYIQAYVTPIPTGNQYSLVFWADGQNGVLTSNTILQLAPGYKRALKYALYIELAASYQIEIPEQVARKAMSSKAQIDKSNLQFNTLNTGFGGRYDINQNRYIS